MPYLYDLVLDLRCTKELDSYCELIWSSGDIFADSTARKRECKANSVVADIDNDYRFAEVRITVINMSEYNTNERVCAKYLGDGVIRLFKSNSKIDDRATKTNQSNLVAKKCVIVAILAVPSYMSMQDFFGFIGEETAKNIVHTRIIRTESNSRYMGILKFRNHDTASKFQAEYNGKLFNSMEPENCHVVFVRNILWGDKSYIAKDSCPLDTIGGNSSKTKTGPLAKSAPPPPMPALTELPTCPVCLDRMDTTQTGLLTIICRHTFHCQCLTKWEDGSCPVCRYSQKDDMANSNPLECAVCKMTENLWMCLICGNVGCGRYDHKHAFDHFTITGHGYSMDLNSQRIWDYASDCYVHRLIQTQEDGKLVELPDQDNGGPSNADNATLTTSSDKLDAVDREYSNLIQMQLESQRMYYEQQLHASADKTAKASAEARKAKGQLFEVTKQLTESQNCNEKNVETINHLENECRALKERIVFLEDKLKTLDENYKDESSINKAISANFESLQREKIRQDEKIEDLEDQIRDLMLHFEMAAKLHANPEIANASMSTSQPQTKTKQKKGTKR
ncbi:hypothetical protein CANCADRAFT_119550 [Tortispora caseinolytica NRRL Y-17796]|uniref:BRCA1-associated protein n=1 Tax=Tortispora caseinolytica NRRL Y-17796 TaxID=767744 RepID=A0A1E4THL1_9ASCO|nr:hypothetical protein CANCADRAFT_119550 [Tortispora caseinolytica NRRL Y-17796]